MGDTYKFEYPKDFNYFYIVPTHTPGAVVSRGASFATEHMGVLRVAESLHSMHTGALDASRDEERKVAWLKWRTTPREAGGGWIKSFPAWADFDSAALALCHAVLRERGAL